jgi:hypothetical protein
LGRVAHLCFQDLYDPKIAMLLKGVSTPSQGKPDGKLKKVAVAKTNPGTPAAAGGSSSSSSAGGGPNMMDEFKKKLEELRVKTPPSKKGKTEEEADSEEE